LCEKVGVEKVGVARSSKRRAMAEHKINVFLRLRPTKKPVSAYEIVDEGGGVVVEVPKDGTEVINNTKERHEYRFAKVFDRDARQEDVFSLVALPTILSALDGFNGTIFAYGQTGSGKTFTITGGPEKYEDRGIIPVLRFLALPVQKYKY